VRCGENVPSHAIVEVEQQVLESKAKENLFERGTDEDVSFNIEADWDGNPDTVLVCVRYKGRRVTTISPHQADVIFCHNLVPPERASSTGAARSCLEKGFEVELSAIMARDDLQVPSSENHDVPVLVQALDRPRLRYAVTAMYSNAGSEYVSLSTDCIRRAKGRSRVSRRGFCHAPVIVAGLGDNLEDVPLQGPHPGIYFYEIVGPSKRN